ncbi:UDP-N-acetyl-D-mannosaminuronic acid transferase [Leifsonia xyli subsp. cynodontis DSM 46306]|uniref:Uncharacterized protein n=1 Tax=Leifsonia xyli subsp. cynodontis DSM 46306 TaxID=1389489 RepID=U3P3S0_LEIXC|nr:UDP-N-acetyl-D-mannosaminuronic acid transferase [Leifsonia xyli subsp. cynodontis DSM 46306]
MILSLNATVVLSAGGIGLAVAGIASPRQTTWPAVIALVLNAAPLGGYALMFGIAWVCSL